MQDKKKDIRAFSKEELEQFFVSKAEKPFRANQVYQWLWQKGVHCFDQMTNLSKSTREMLNDNFVINHVKVDLMQRSSDGTIKNAVKLHDGLMVESVLIPTDKRTTACVSSQVGCSLDCLFCATSRLKRMRNLKADEIVDQVSLIDKQSRLYFNRPLSNIVFMGMGEPLMNYSNVIKAIDKITSDDALAMSPKRITVSTSGISKLIKKMADDQVKFNLAVSLHSAIEATRNSIMPFTKSFPIKELEESLSYWYQKTKSKVTFEYVVWKGVNDNQTEVASLVSLCKKIPSKVNIIQYNAIGDPQFVSASNQMIDYYQKSLEANGIVAKIRRSRGEDIDAACGQLANKSQE